MRQAPKALTLRLDGSAFRRLARIARDENRTPTNYVETLVLRDLEAKDEARRVISVYAAPEATDVTPEKIERSVAESDERYAEREALMRELLSIPDAE